MPANGRVTRIHAVDLDRVQELGRQRYGTIVSRVLKELIAGAPRPAADVTVLTARRAHAYLETVHAYAEAIASQRAQAMSSAEWLWYLRRVPDEVFAGQLHTTAPYDRALAETLGAMSTKASTAMSRDTRTPGGLLYPVTGNRIDRVLALCATAIFLSGIQSHLRRAAKGQTFHVDRDYLVRAVDDPALERAIQIYDRRGARGTISWATSGTRMLTEPADDFVSNLMDPRQPPTGWDILSIADTGDWRWIPVIYRVDGEIMRAEVLGHWVPRFERLDDSEHAFLRKPTVRDARWWPDELPALMVLAHLAARGIFGSEGGSINASRYGYLIISADAFHDYATETFPHIQKQFIDVFGAGDQPVHDLLARVSAANGSVWPLQLGQVVRPLGASDVMVDLNALAMRIADGLLVGRSGGGHLPNERASHFELAVQDVIDDGAYAPPGRVRQLRGRTLKLRGAAITDIDAMAVREQQLLLISCKARPHTAAYDRGEPRAVHNAALQIARDVSDWEDKIDQLRRSPVGDNYDLSGFDEIVGVVCTPHHLFSTNDMVLATAVSAATGRLRRACSFSELARFVQL